VGIEESVIISVIVKNNKLESCMKSIEFPLTVLPLAGITVEKKTVGGTGTFDFTGISFPATCTALNGAFQLSTSESTIGSIKSCSDLLPDQDYIIGEVGETNSPLLWDLTGIAVTIGTDPNGVAYPTTIQYGPDGQTWHDGNPASDDRYVKIHLASGDSPTITFTNTKRQIDLALSVTANETACCGGPTTYIVTLTNNDPTFAATNIVVKDILDANTAFNLATPEAGTTFDEAPMQWTVPLLAAGDSVTLILAAICSPTYLGTITNQVQIVSFDLMGSDPVTTNNAVTTDTSVKGCGSITVIKDAIPIDGSGYSSQAFTFDSDTLGTFILVDDVPEGSSDRITFNNLVPGDYQIIERSKTDWTLNFINCIGAENTDLLPNVNGMIIHLGVGESATVTFVNAQSTGPLPPTDPLTITKTTLNTSVHRGEDIIYNIEVCNEGPYGLQNVTVWDILPAGVELVSVYPQPASSSNLTWFIGTLEPKGKSDSCFLAQIVVRVPVVDINYDMSQDVQGEGFVNVHNDYDTHQGPESVTNCAYAKADLTETVSSCATTGIVDPGTELKRREFGSGTYASEENTRVRTENKSIKTVTSLSAIHKPTTFSLPQGRSIGYATKWTEKSQGINSITGANMNEEYTSATKINKERSIELDKNGSTMKTEVEFAGQGHIGVLKKQAPDSHPKVKTVFESREDYAGTFKIYEMVDEYGSSVVSNKSTSGFGYVAVDKRIRDSQRTYESGTGFYQSEELIDTPTSYMAKNISLVHAPAGYSYSPTFIADQDMLWREGMWSKSGDLRGGNLITDTGLSRQLATSSCLANGTSPGTLISEKYSYLDNLQKETVASGLNEMKSEASFSGTADYRVLSHDENGTSVVDNEERYVGSYDINRHVLLTGTSKYDIPHLTVIKEGRIKNEWYNKVNATMAEYTITITNDGNRALAPIYVRDLFPAGTQYVTSTIRPASLAANEANWTLLHLGIGNTITIGLTLNITEGSPGNNLVNRVVACGMSGDKSVCAGNYSSLEFGWQTCCPPEVLVSKKAWLDESDPTEVHYRIVVKNNAPDSVAVTVTDQMSGGMTLLGASINPNTDNIGQMVWALPEIKPGRIETIDYTARALRDGGYTSTVHIDATAINGTGYDTMDASAYIEITRTGVAARTFRYDDWEPPAWNLSAPEPGLNMDPVLELEVDPGTSG